MTDELSGQTVLVTGASRGIGAAIAEAALEGGARAVLHFNSGEGACSALLDRYGADHCRLIQADLSHRDQTEQLWSGALDWADRISAIVNNAAVMLNDRVEGPAENWQRGWDTTLAVNVVAVADLCRNAILHFKETGGGSIVNIASRAGFRGDLPDAMHYAASKGAVVALTRSIAKGYAPDDILAYTLAPGWVATERVRPWLEGEENAFKIAEIPLGRPADPGEIGAVVNFLLSGKAPSLTGTTIDINGASYFH